MDQESSERVSICYFDINEPSPAPNDVVRAVPACRWRRQWRYNGLRMDGGGDLDLRVREGGTGPWTGGYRGRGQRRRPTSTRSSLPVCRGDCVHVLLLRQHLWCSSSLIWPWLWRWLWRRQALGYVRLDFSFDGIRCDAPGYLVRGHKQFATKPRSVRLMRHCMACPPPPRALSLSHSSIGLLVRVAAPAHANRVDLTRLSLPEMKSGSSRCASNARAD